MELGLPGAEFVRVMVPDIPTITMPAPGPANTSVVPVEGPRGPKGDTGDGRVAAWFTGHGPPPAVIIGAAVGDMYVDLDTGALYQLS